MIKSTLSPHFIRIFSAGLLWIALLALISVNLVNMPKNSMDVLGAFSESQQELHRKQAEIETVQHEYAFWQGVVKEKPDYRDGYITLASLAYQLGKTQEMSAHLSQAQKLDPNNGIAKQLLPLLP